MNDSILFLFEAIEELVELRAKSRRKIKKLHKKVKRIERRG